MPLYQSFRHLLFMLDPEAAHNWAIRALTPLPAPKLRSHHPALKITVADIHFPTPVGLAAGFDKQGNAPGRLLGFGFGSVEIGTVTPLPQHGNPSPRVFRLEEDEAIINRFGLNSDGHDAVARRLARRTAKPGIVGVNIGANTASRDKIADYAAGVRRFSQLAAYLTVNISCPNTPGLEDLHSKVQLRSLIREVVEVRDEIGGPPIFLKVSPDLSEKAIADVSAVAIECRIQGLIVGNTTTSRPRTLKSKRASMEGGLSGPPLGPIALNALRLFRKEIGTEIPLISVGGIASAQDAYERILAGASLVQLHTALAYKGPGVVGQINRDLVALLERDGFNSISQAIGISAPQAKSQRASKKQKALALA